ncbi:MAG: flavin-dependent oxidoreductase, F420-dependent methylene-tetrahydromethanopterin reductase [Ilumatobacteraceae bacterium]|nr:flavin-dependent oxidoreductase, F420-dependent methylene-tetrahydromethanopterin reductase [Ilumatobacteraceae bacterium]MCU1387842.1 flavin-dependent oxidoreductase, F420-dependent methylene-tetrahydromethanopterin reductase [Ilumatobacteraceae bacterium]
MQIAMTLPTMLAHGRAETLGWCRGIDEGPFSSLAVPERITFTSHSWTVELAAAAALTERVRLWTTVVVLPAHDAVQVAKDLASVDQLAAGRLTVGIGVGGREHDYRAVGGDYSRRWSRMDEQVATMRRIWAQEAPFEGADPVGPPPVQPGGPPLVAGVIGPKAMARAAVWAAGVDDPTSITSVDTQALAQRRELVEAAWKAAGRAEAPHFSASLWYALGPDSQRRLGDYVFDYMKIFDAGFARQMAEAAPVYTAEALREAVAAAEAAGCDELFLVPTTADPVELDRTREALGI